MRWSPFVGDRLAGATFIDPGASYLYGGGNEAAGRGMPRLLHVADTHLGFQAYARLNGEGLNQREVDAQEAFRRVIDRAVADPPDVFLHAGDLFDHPRPNNRAIAFALHEIRRLSDARIPTVLVSGNHDAPRMRETGSIFRIFDGLPSVHAVYRGAAESVDVAGVTVHAVPQAVSQEAFQSQLRAAAPTGPGPHVLLVHGTVLGVDGLYSSEFNEYQIPGSALLPEFDYVALGHFHATKRVAPNAWYAGSTEGFSFAEADQEKVVLDVDVGTGEARVRTHPTGARPLADLGRIDGRGLEPATLFESAATRLRSAPRDAVARLTIHALDRGVARAVDWDALRALRSDLCHLELRTELADDAVAIDGGLELAPLGSEFDAFLARRPLASADREHVRTEALRLLAEGGKTARAA